MQSHVVARPSAPVHTRSSDCGGLPGLADAACLDLHFFQDCTAAAAFWSDISRGHYIQALSGGRSPRGTSSSLQHRSSIRDPRPPQRCCGRSLSMAIAPCLACGITKHTRCDLTYTQDVRHRVYTQHHSVRMFESPLAMDLASTILRYLNVLCVWTEGGGLGNESIYYHKSLLRAWKEVL